MAERPARALILAVAGMAAMLDALPALAIVDEIQVYTDDLDARGESGLEVHVNTTPRGRKTPDYDGDLPPYHSTRITPEFSWGLGNNFESGLYFPSAVDVHGNLYVSGVKARLKWLPVHGGEGEGGWYFGANSEISDLSQKYSESRLSAELRVIGGYRAKDWLIGMNPIFEWGLSPDQRGSPEVTLAWKAAHRIAEGISLGGEYYDGIGTLGERLSRDRQERTLYLVADIERKSWSVNFGIGHGLTPATDNWTVKAIFGFSFG
jgi:hypothetical protein